MLTLGVLSMSLVPAIFFQQTELYSLGYELMLSGRERIGF
jgi:hypothetical protein